MDHVRITIVVRRPENGNGGYIGATYDRDPLPGEDWRRGGDLADGKHNSETVERIIRDINRMIELDSKYEPDDPEIQVNLPSGPGAP